jgi:hypothetical protein
MGSKVFKSDAKICTGVYICIADGVHHLENPKVQEDFAYTG